MTTGERRRRDAPPMAGPVGSVYLDAPGPSRFRTLPRARAHAPRVAVAGMLTLAGLLALSVAGLAAGIRALVGEPGPVAEAIDAALDQPLVREEVEAEIVVAIERDLVGAEVSEAVTGFGVDVEAEAARIAGTVLDDPAFRNALTDLVTDVHQRILVEPDPRPLDLGPLTDAIVAVIDAESPALAAVVPERRLIADVTAADLPDMSAPMDQVDRALLLVPVGVLALALAAALHPRRHRVLAWTGRALLAAGLVAAILAVGLPWLGGELTGWTTVESAVRTISLRLIAPAGVAGVAGMGIVSAAAVAQSRERKRVSAEGAAAALGVDEPAPALSLPPSASMELARRGLAHTGERLTSR